MDGHRERLRRLLENWPRPLDALQIGDAVAIETAALAIRVVCSHLKDLDASLATDGPENALVAFARHHDDMTRALTREEQTELLHKICAEFGLTEGRLTFDALMGHDLITKAVWDTPELRFCNIYYQAGPDDRFVLGQLTPSDTNDFEWDGEEELGDKISRMLGEKDMGELAGWVGWTMPPVFRVIFTPSAGSTARYKDMNCICIGGPLIELDTATGGLHTDWVMRRYVLVGVIRHRRGRDLELARFYGQAGPYIAPPTTVDGAPVERPYVSDSWLVGEEGATYTLLYALALYPHYPCREFVPADALLAHSRRVEALKLDGLEDSGRRRPRLPEGFLDGEDTEAEDETQESQQTLLTATSAGRSQAQSQGQDSESVAAQPGEPAAMTEHDLFQGLGFSDN